MKEVSVFANLAVRLQISFSASSNSFFNSSSLSLDNRGSKKRSAIIFFAYLIFNLKNVGGLDKLYLYYIQIYRVALINEKKVIHKNVRHLDFDKISVSFSI